jgi:carboxylesterase type B
MAARTPSGPADKPAAEKTADDANELLGGEPAAEESLEALRARIKALESENEKLAAAKDLAEEESARLSAQAQSSLLTSSVLERFAGKADDGSDLWWYRIDLAPCGGTDIKINGRPYLHGETYKFDTDTLRTVKEIVSRTWVHENDINGHSFNPYRQQQMKVLGGGPVPNWARN